MKNFASKNNNLILKTAETRMVLERERALLLKAKKIQKNYISNTSSSYVTKKIIKNKFIKSSNNYEKQRREIPIWNGSSIYACQN